MLFWLQAVVEDMVSKVSICEDSEDDNSCRILQANNANTGDFNCDDAAPQMLPFDTVDGGVPVADRLLAAGQQDPATDNCDWSSLKSNNLVEDNLNTAPVRTQNGFDQGEMNTSTSEISDSAVAGGREETLKFEHSFAVVILKKWLW